MITDAALRSEVQWLPNSRIPLVRVKQGHPFAVIPVGAGVGYYMHWVPELDRTQPCLLPPCPHCDNGDPRRPLSYLPVMVFRRFEQEYLWQQAILEVPYDSGKILSSMVGKRVCVGRDRKFGPVNIGHFLFEEEMPELKPFKFVELLLRLWRVPEGRQLALIGNLGPIAD